jgi:hypothetical protein
MWLVKADFISNMFVLIGSSKIQLDTFKYVNGTFICCVLLLTVLNVLKCNGFIINLIIEYFIQPK